MDNLISVIIPVRNGENTIAHCLDAVFNSHYRNFEVIVVDDSSEDDSVGKIGTFPCRLIQLSQHSGASRARNVGAQQSRGAILFFVDADCMVQKDTLALVNSAYNRKGPDVVIGGTYTMIPIDDSFFSIFQSVFIHYSETKNATEPDYVATHAMALDAGVFKKSGGFAEDFLPMIEDVEFSHRLKKAGLTLEIIPALEVEHIFGFSLKRSLLNAYTKAHFWTVYSMENRDIMADSGTASSELKLNVISYFMMIVLAVMWGVSKNSFVLVVTPALLVVNIMFNCKLLKAYYTAKGTLFAFLSSMYYLFVYPLAVGYGAVTGLLRYVIGHRTSKQHQINSKD